MRLPYFIPPSSLRLQRVTIGRGEQITPSTPVKISPHDPQPKFGVYQRVPFPSESPGGIDLIVLFHVLPP